MMIPTTQKLEDELVVVSDTMKTNKIGQAHRASSSAPSHNINDLNIDVRTGAKNIKL